MQTTTNPLSAAIERIKSGEFEYVYKGHTIPLKKMNSVDRAKAIETRNEMNRLEADSRQRFRKMLAELYGLTEYKNEEKLFNKAWEDGHASGHTEVALHYDDLAALLT